MTFRPPHPDADDPGDTTLRLAFHSGGLRLVGTLHLPERSLPNLIVGSHGLYSSGDSPKQVELARRCCGMGIAYFRFDHRGCGQSEGRFKEVTSLAGRREDIVEAVAFLRSQFALGAGLGLFGSSLGGATCLSAAPLLKPWRMVTLAAPVDSRSILAAGSDLRSPVDSVFRQEAFQFDLWDHLHFLKGILVIHGGQDEVISPQHADMIYEAVGHPKERLILSEGDHRLSRPDHRQAFVRASLDWFRPLAETASTA